MSQGRGDLGPGSYSLLWFLHSKLRFKRQRLSLHTFSINNLVWPTWEISKIEKRCEIQRKMREKRLLVFDFKGHLEMI